MSPWQAGAPSLDARSRRIMARVGAAMLAIALCVGVTLALHGEDMGRVTAMLSLACTAGAVLAMLGACRRHDRLDPARLNGWDESLALNFLALSMHMLGHLHPA